MAKLPKEWKWTGAIAPAIVILLACPPVAFSIEILRFVVPEGWPTPPPGISMLAGLLWLMVTFGTMWVFAIVFVVHRRPGLIGGLVGLCALLVGTFPVVQPINRVAIRHGVARVGNSAQPIVTALRHYESEHKTFPRTLEDLVPRYLAQVPRTGLAAFKNYSYEPTVTESGAHSFDLWVDTPQGVLDFDDILYLNDPDDLHRVNSVIVGDWGHFDD